ncbi:glutamate decarboxylase 1-like isoform X2 [Asterias rubens]|uniref:glutamate decarboxylase 1-like isoform X2 n=1 Tax=Asterias rubens TaxID=7604 RepID=UPI001454FEFB|nr:glutamate decarboxylase 1-like isoform X2 [Asterias rubens]
MVQVFICLNRISCICNSHFYLQSQDYINIFKQFARITTTQNNMLSDSNFIETVSEEVELLQSENCGNQENEPSPNNDNNPNQVAKNNATSNVAVPKRRLVGDRPRLVDRTVSEGQLLVPKKSIALQDEEDRPDFYEFRAKDLLPSKGGAGLTTKFLKEVVEILVEYVQGTFDRSTKILEFHHPNELRERLHLEIPDKPENLDQILQDCQNTLKYCVHTGHPRFFNQLSTGLDIISLAGEWVTAAANTNMFTYEIAPVFLLMERAILKKMREMVGYKDGDGIFAPGGAVSNLYAVQCARHKYVPSCKRRGLQSSSRNLVLFTSEHSHFSLRRAAAILGIGTDNVVYVDTDVRGKMKMEDLENKIQQAIARGDKPFFVNATAGTTVLGAFDPINAVADICEKYDLWMHVDGAWGGGLLMSRKHRHKLEGVHRADSVTWNPHKVMGALLQCSAILLKEDGILEDANSMRAPYLFQQDKHYDVSYDTGDKAIQCGRHVDVFKFWLMWRAKGTRGFENHINKLFDLAQYLLEKLKSREGFKVVHEKPEYTNVCFWYIPPSLRSMEEGTEKQLRLHKVAPAIKGRMMATGTLMVGYQPLGDKVNFFRSVFSNPAATKSDVDFLLDELERLGRDL